MKIGFHAHRNDVKMSMHLRSHLTVGEFRLKVKVLRKWGAKWLGKVV